MIALLLSIGVDTKVAVPIGILGDLVLAYTIVRCL